jgi:hypothetical protein
MSTYAERFSQYFDREVAQKAAKSLGNGCEIEFKVGTEIFTFTKEEGKNSIQPSASRDPQLLFTLTPGAADAILADTATDIGSIGVNIAKLIVSGDADKKVAIKFKAGFLTLFSKGYLGVLTAGGSQFGAFLASKGLNGMGAIKDALKKMKA